MWRPPTRTGMALRGRAVQIVNPTGADALDVCLLHYRDQRTLGAPSGFEHAREEAAIAHPRYLQLDRAYARIPWAFAIPIAVAGPLERPFVSLRPEVLADLELHQPLGEHAHALTQKLTRI